MKIGISKIEIIEFKGAKPTRRKVNYVELDFLNYNRMAEITTTGKKKLVLKDNHLCDGNYVEVPRELFKGLLFVDEEYEVEIDDSNANKYNDGQIIKIEDVSIKMR